MATDDNAAGKRAKPASPQGGLARLGALLSSMPFAVAVVAALTASCIVGTLLPQGGEVAQYLTANPGAGGTMRLLGALGLTHVFSSVWFIALLGLLALSLAVCTYRRFRAAIDRAGQARGRAIGSVVTHVSLLLVLAGGVIRGVWGERGDLPLREGETSNHFLVQGRLVELPFSIRLVDFELETYAPADQRRPPPAAAGRLLISSRASGAEWDLPAEPGVEHMLAPAGQAAGDGFRVKVVRSVPDFVIDMTTREVTSRSDQPRNPAILVETSHHGQTDRQWLFALHPGFDMHASGDTLRSLELRYVIEASPPGTTIKDYKSTLQVIEGAEVVVEKTIEVNRPLSHAGYTFYQSGFDPDDLEWTSLQVVKDPGVPLVYTGFVLMTAGLLAVFYLYPRDRAQAAANRNAHSEEQS